MVRTADASEALTAVGAGDEAAAHRLMPLVYDELRSLAATYLRRLQPGQALQPTEVVHEAFVRLVRQGARTPQNEAHFFAVAARAMRCLIIDHIRRRNADKRSGRRNRVALSGMDPIDRGRIVDLLVLDDALARLERRNERQARVIEYSCFGGLTVEQIARVLGLTKTTIEGDLRVARAWLSSELKDTEPPA